MDSMNVEIFVPCFIDQIFPDTAFSMIKVLERAGCKVNYNEAQTCCGQPAFNSGFWDEAKEVGQKFLNDFSDQHYIVSPSASCVGMVRNYYSELFTNSASHNKCRAVQGNIFEFSDFMINVLKIENVGAEFDATATYHDSCAALRECGIKEAPRKLLENVRKLRMYEMKDNETCCGFGGTFSVKFDGISSAMAEQKTMHALETGAEYIISTDASCLMQIQGYIDKNKLDLKTIHIADVLAKGW